MKDIAGTFLAVLILIVGPICMAFTVSLWLEEHKCRQAHNVYQCERIYVPVTTQEDKP